VSREELLSEHSAMTDASKCSPAATATAAAAAAATQWKFLCIEGCTL